MRITVIFCRVLTILIILMTAFVSCGKESSQPTDNERPPATEEVNGTLTEIEGVWILRIWGTPQKQGYAHGYLVAGEIVTMLDNLLTCSVLGLDADIWENEVIPAINIFRIEKRFEEELQGMLAGIEAKMGGKVNIPSLGRALQYEDLAAVHIGPDFFGVRCSSFAAWGSMTTDENTITGRNFDWQEVPGVFEKQFVIVYVPTPESERLGFVTINWPGSIGCSTAMNAEGVTLNINNTNGYPPTHTTGFHPRILIYREAIEAAHAGTAREDVENVLKTRMTATPQNLMITIPYSGHNRESVVFEYDGNLSVDGGVTVREPDSTEYFQICTNHCRQRKQPIVCERYALLDEQLQSIAASGGTSHLTREKAWELLDAVAVNNPTHHRVVFEPNKRLMHVALSVVNPAPQCNFVTLNVSDLLEGIFDTSK